jgi:hypothetical protein
MSITATPSLTISAVISLGIPAATTIISAVLVKTCNCWTCPIVVLACSS